MLILLLLQKTEVSIGCVVVDDVTTGPPAEDGVSLRCLVRRFWYHTLI